MVASGSNPKPPAQRLTRPRRSKRGLHTLNPPIVRAASAPRQTGVGGCVEARLAASRPAADVANSSEVLCWYWFSAS
jgi:hypothetical protein